MIRNHTEMRTLGSFRGAQTPQMAHRTQYRRIATTNGSGQTVQQGGGTPQITNVGRLAVDGAIRAVSPRAVRLLATCACIIDSDGTICASVVELARAVGWGREYTSEVLRELVVEGLVHVSGKARGTYRYLDPKVVKALQVPLTRRTHDVGWRQLRARVGGFERALRAAMKQRDDAHAQIEAMRHRPPPPEVQGKLISWLLTELRHASDCLYADCARCAATTRRLEDPDHEVAVDIVHQVDALQRAAATAVKAVRARNGDALREAMSVLEQVVQS